MYTSLYPSIIISANISIDTYSPLSSDNEHTFSLSQGGKASVDWNSKYVAVGQEQGYHRFWLANEGSAKACMKALIEERKRVGKKTDAGIALKVLANSFYGAWGASTSSLYYPELAESVTAIGRWLVTVASIVAESMGMQLIYGDTDSVFLAKSHLIKERNGSDTYLKVFNKILEFTPLNGVKLEAEDYTFDRLVMVAKKNYVGLSKDGKMICKGMAQVRKSTVLLVRKFVEDYSSTLMQMNLGNISSLRSLVRTYVEIVRSGKLTSDLVSYEVKSDGVPCRGYVNAIGERVTVPIDTQLPSNIPYSASYILERMQGSVNAMQSAANLPSLSELCL